MKKLVSAVLAFVISLTMLMGSGSQNAEAADSYISAGSFINSLIASMGLEIDDTASKPYVEAAIKAGIVKEGEFKKYSSKITRTDAAVILNRADEYLHGDNVDAELLATVLEKRISDLNKITKSKREAVAKIYAKGIITGYSNGYYIQNRAFRGSKYLTKNDAKIVISRVVNTNKRAKLSPDGMVIRTTNLPKNASNYEYILECYPNKFYERKFEFMQVIDWKTVLVADDFCYPAGMRDWTFRNWNHQWAFSEEMDKYLYDWTALAEKYLNYLFNVDYRTVDDEWVEGLASVYVNSNIDEADSIRSYYLKYLKENHVLVESTIIAVEPSSLYYNMGYNMRAYVKYRIIADDVTVKQNRLIFAQYPALDNIKSGEWREGIFDIQFGSNNGSTGDGGDFAINILTRFNDSFNVIID